MGLGILVTGAEKVEAKVGRLRSKLAPLSERMDRAKARTRLAWQAVEKQLRQDKRTTLRNTELTGRRMLKKIIESTIQELEKLSRKLETDAGIRGYAS